MSLKLALIIGAIVTVIVGIVITLLLLPGNSTPSANLLACQHYEVQRAYVKHLATPTLADALKFNTWLASDVDESTGQLHADFTTFYTAEQDVWSNKTPAVSVNDASMRVYHDCTALGVKFNPPG